MIDRIPALLNWQWIYAPRKGRCSLISVLKGLSPALFQSLQRSNYYLDPSHFKINALFICSSYGTSDLLKGVVSVEPALGRKLGSFNCTHSTKNPTTNVKITLESKGEVAELIHRWKKFQDPSLPFPLYLSEIFPLPSMGCRQMIKCLSGSLCPLASDGLGTGSVIIRLILSD